MNRTEKADVLLEKLKADSVEYKALETGGYSLEEKKNAIRSLMNIRMPRELSDELVDLQNEYLQEERKAKGVVTLSDIPTIKEQLNSSASHADKVSLWQGDITRLEVGAIVNAANSQMLGCFVPCHRCIDNAIHSAAGIQLRWECSQIMKQQGHEEETGKAKITKGYNLPCKHVIHTVGPIIYGKLTERDCRLLRSCYESCLELAQNSGLKSIAFCCISTGEFHFPNEKAAEIAVAAVTDFLKNSRLERVIFNVFKEYDKSLYEQILK